jgi:hypothetical protein
MSKKGNAGCHKTKSGIYYMYPKEKGKYRHRKDETSCTKRNYYQHYLLC